MKKNEEPFQMKGKGMAAAIAICFIAVVALVGAYTFSSYKREMKEQLAKAEEEQKEKEREVEEKEQSEAANTDRIVLPEQEEAAQNPDGEEQQEEGEATEHAKELGQNGRRESTTAAAGTAAYFSEEDTLLWPVDGNVIMNYSMDQSIYFATLDQYKYNPAVVISGQVGAEVKAAAAGTVSAVDTNAQTGTTVIFLYGEWLCSHLRTTQRSTGTARRVCDRKQCDRLCERTNKVLQCRRSKLIFPAVKRWTASQPNGPYRIRIENRKRKDPEEKVLQNCFGIFSFFVNRREKHPI